MSEQFTRDEIKERSQYHALQAYPSHDAHYRILGSRYRTWALYRGEETVGFVRNDRMMRAIVDELNKMHAQLQEV